MVGRISIIKNVKIIQDLTGSITEYCFERERTGVSHFEIIIRLGRKINFLKRMVLGEFEF